MPRMVFHYVEFHADSGQSCTKGLRRFEDQSKADEFAALLRSEPGHGCAESVRQFDSPNRYPEVGMIAAGGPRTGTDHWRKMLKLTGNGPEI
jgi:hypothetical protein